MEREKLALCGKLFWKFFEDRGLYLWGRLRHDPPDPPGDRPPRALAGRPGDPGRAGGEREHPWPHRGEHRHLSWATGWPGTWGRPWPPSGWCCPPSSSSTCSALCSGSSRPSRRCAYAFWGVRVAVVSLVASALLTMLRQCPQELALVPAGGRGLSAGGLRRGQRHPGAASAAPWLGLAATRWLGGR